MSLYRLKWSTRCPGKARRCERSFFPCVISERLITLPLATFKTVKFTGVKNF